MTENEISELVTHSTLSILNNLPSLADMTPQEYQYSVACIGLGLVQTVIANHGKNSQLLSHFLDGIRSNIAARIPDQGLTLEFKITDLSNPTNQQMTPPTKEESILRLRRLIDPS